MLIRNAATAFTDIWEQLSFPEIIQAGGSHLIVSGSEGFLI